MRFTRRAFWTVAIVGIVAVVTLSGAQLWRTSAPDLRRLYASGMEPVRVPPVIIIPGILGSRLRERSSGHEIWSTDVFFPLAYAFFLCVDHEHLPGNISFQDNLLNVLLEREQPWENPLRENPLPTAPPDPVR